MTQGTTQGETELHLKIESHNHWWYRWKYELRENDELVVWNYPILKKELYVRLNVPIGGAENHGSVVVTEQK